MNRRNFLYGTAGALTLALTGCGGVASKNSKPSASGSAAGAISAQGFGKPDDVGQARIDAFKKAFRRRRCTSMRATSTRSSSCPRWSARDDRDDRGRQGLRHSGVLQHPQHPGERVSGALFFTMIVLSINALQMFDQAYTMFFGGQQNSTYANDAALFYVIYLFQQAFGVLHMGYASALAWLLFLIIIVISSIQVRLSKRFVYYENER